MKKKHLHSATRCHAVSQNSIWFFRIAPVLLLLFVPGTSCNGISDPPSNVPSSLRNSQVCAGFCCGSSECVEYDQICDSVQNCADGSDENPAACINRTCEAVLDSGDKQPDSVVKSWRCDNGECISDVYRCDGQANCEDASDETEFGCFDRRCTPAQFTCKTGQCIPKSNVCDGKEHCFDGTDEQRDMCRDFLRNRTICPPRLLNYCADRTQCYRKLQLCDGEMDCLDGSDEDPETCGINESTNVVFPDTETQPQYDTETQPHNDTETQPHNDSETQPHNDIHNLTTTQCDPPSCPCPVPGMEHVCLPCHELDNVTNTCIQMQKEARVCSLGGISEDIKVDILACGGESWQNECVSTDMVPEMTVVIADCWSTASIVLRCHSDGTWGEYGVTTSDAERMRRICQPRHINSQVCGRKPRYKKLGEQLDPTNFYSRRNLHPWLLEVKRGEKYECSATLITNRWLITAAQCVNRNQGKNDETVDPRNFKVQLDPGNNSDKFTEQVDEIWVHPQYVSGSRPLNDIALIRLEAPLLLNGSKYPACVDLNGDGFLTSAFAMTFSRPNGENRYEYETVLQQVDRSCDSRLSQCTSLVFEHSQFCDKDKEEENNLLGGSSGDPFMQNLGSDYNESWAVSGIVSHTVQQKNCGLPFTIYTSVHHYKDWIQEVINSGP